MLYMLMHRTRSLRLREEVDILKHLSQAAARAGFGLRHPNVLGYIDSWEEDETLFIQTELCALGNFAHFPFKQCPFTIGRSVLGHRPGPDGCHAEVANLESAFACDEYVSGFEIKMNDAGVVDESQALRRVVSK